MEKRPDPPPRRPAKLARARVADVFTEGLISIPVDSSLEALASLLHQKGIQGAAVTDEFGCVVGVATQTDLTRAASWDLDPECSTTPEHEDDPWPEPRVGDIATLAIHAVDAEVTLSKATRQMMAKGMRRLLVRRDGRYVGMLTAGDLMKAWVEEVDQSASAEPCGVQARLERHLRAVEGVPGAMARQIARRRAQAWSHRLRLREQRSAELERRLREERERNDEVA